MPPLLYIVTYCCILCQLDISYLYIIKRTPKVKPKVMLHWKLELPKIPVFSSGSSGWHTHMAVFKLMTGHKWGPWVCVCMCVRDRENVCVVFKHVWRGILPARSLVLGTKQNPTVSPPPLTTEMPTYSWQVVQNKRWSMNIQEWQNLHLCFPCPAFHGSSDLVTRNSMVPTTVMHLNIKPEMISFNVMTEVNVEVMHTAPVNKPGTLIWSHFPFTQQIGFEWPRILHTIYLNAQTSRSKYLRIS